MSRYVATVGFLLLSTCARAHDHVEGTHTASKERSSVSPAVEQGDKKFFGKDYPYDKRPAVDVLHFNHPYPVVQDSGDFDADYVKDENHDDGSWAAQTEYDRLRHKLRKEKADIAKALHKKANAEKELQEAMQRRQEARKTHENEVARVRAANKAKDLAKAKREAARAAADKQVPDGTGQNAEPEEEEEQIPGGTFSPGDVKVATDGVQKAMDSLEDCKKELQAARERLKKLMEELKEKHQKQDATQAAADTAVARQKDLAAGSELASKKVKTEYEEYMKARNEYLAQQAAVAKMEQDLKSAAAKVKAVRDAEDRNGGVYNSQERPHSAAHFSGSLPIMVLMAVTTLFCAMN